MQCGSETYCFTGKQLRALAHLMRRVGLVLWQQALLFPQVRFGGSGTHIWVLQCSGFLLWAGYGVWAMVGLAMPVGLTQLNKAGATGAAAPLSRPAP